MGNELITVAQILAGGGLTAWAGDKIFAPSFEAIGEELKIYASDRVNKFLQAVRNKNFSEDASPLAPALALKVIQGVSLSEDDDLLTQMWANLVAEAARDKRPYHTLFIEMLSQIGPEQARLLDGLNVDLNQERLIALDVAYKDFAKGFASVPWQAIYSEQTANEMMRALFLMKHRFPGFMKSVSTLPVYDDLYTPMTINVMNRLSIDIFERQNLLEEFCMVHPKYAEDATSPRVTFSVLTELGYQFLKSVKG